MMGCRPHGAASVPPPLLHPNTISLYLLLLLTAAVSPHEDRPEEKPADIVFDLKSPVDEYVDKDAIVTPHPFKYIINNEGLCRDGVDLLIAMHSSPQNRKRRMAMRGTLDAISSVLPQFKLTKAFFMGQTLDGSFAAALKLENSFYGDIIQEDFIDHYHNLSLKNVAWMKWTSQKCPKASLIIRCDDDIALQPTMIELLMSRYASKVKELELDNKLFCYTYGAGSMPVLRSGKWGVPKEVFAADYYPPYCAGAGYFLTPATAKSLFLASRKTPFFWVDDVWATGMVAKTANVTHVGVHSLYLFGENMELKQRVYNVRKEMRPSYNHVPGEMDVLESVVEEVLLYKYNYQKNYIPWWRHDPQEYAALQLRRDTLRNRSRL